MAHDYYMATAGKTIKQFEELESAEAQDILLIVDESEDETKHITKGNFLQEYYDRDELDAINATFQLLSQRGQANGYVPLDAEGKIASQYIPPLALTDVYVVEDIEERDALVVQEGDFAIVTGENKTYVFTGTNWTEISATADVLSVNGQIGTVELNTDDISEGVSNLYYTQARFNTAFSGKSTSNLTEGTNLYYTDARVASYLGNNGYLQAGGNISNLINDAGYLTSYSETDPIFSASPAFGITNTAISNWNSAYGWGNHASAGYLVNGTHWTKTGTVLSYMAGNVGIGTTSPGSKLTIGSTAASASVPIIDVTSDTTSLKYPKLIKLTASTGGSIELEGAASAGFLPSLKFTADSAMSGLGGGITGVTTTDTINASGLGVVNLDGRLASGALVNSNIFSVASYGNPKIVVSAVGNLGIGTTSPTAKLDISSDILRLRTAKTPATSGATGNQGDFCWDASYIYVCIATNSWKRASLATW